MWRERKRKSQPLYNLPDMVPAVVNVYPLDTDDNAGVAP
jgi:hypothetical protein